MKVKYTQINIHTKIIKCVNYCWPAITKKFQRMFFKLKENCAKGKRRNVIKVGKIEEKNKAMNVFVT